MSPEAKAQLSEIREKIRKNKGQQDKYLSKIKKKQSPWKMIAKLLLKLKIDNKITKFLYSQLNKGSKMESMVAIYNVTEDEAMRKSLKSKIMQLKGTMVNDAAIYIQFNRMIQTYKLFSKVTESLKDIFNKDLMTNKIEDHDHLIILKAERIAHSVDFNRIVMLDAIDNLLGGYVHSDSDPVTQSDVENESIMESKSGLKLTHVLMGGLATLSYNFLTVKKQEELEEKGQEVLETLKDEVEFEEENPQVGHQFSNPIEAPDLEAKLREAEEIAKGDPYKVPKNGETKLPAAVIKNRMDRLQEVVDLGLYDKMVEDVIRPESKKGNYYNLSSEEINILKNLPSMLKSRDPKLIQYLSSPRSSISTVIKGVDIDSPEKVQSQYRKNKTVSLDLKGRSIARKVWLDFNAETKQNKDLFTYKNVKKYIDSHKYPVRDKEKLAQEVMKLGFPDGSSPLDNIPWQAKAVMAFAKGVVTAKTIAPMLTNMNLFSIAPTAKLVWDNLGNGNTTPKPQPKPVLAQPKPRMTLRSTRTTKTNINK